MGRGDVVGVGIACGVDGVHARGVGGVPGVGVGVDEWGRVRTYPAVPTHRCCGCPCLVSVGAGSVSVGGEYVGGAWERRARAWAACAWVVWAWAAR